MLPWGAGDSEAEPLALHRLRLSATSLRLQWCAPTGLGLGLAPPAADQELRPASSPAWASPGQPTASPRPVGRHILAGRPHRPGPPHRCGQPGSQELGTPLPVGLTVDGVRIEIGRAQPDGL